MTIQEFKDIQLSKQTSLILIEKMKFAFHHDLILMEKKEKSALKKERDRQFISRNTSQSKVLIRIKESHTFYVFDESKNETYEVFLPSDFDDHYIELQRLVETTPTHKDDGYRYLGYVIITIGFILGIILGGSIPVLSIERYNTFNIGVALTVWISSFFASMFWFWADDILKAMRENNKDKR